MTGYVEYMERTRLFYRAQGFEQDYTWTHNTKAPFIPLVKPLASCVVGLVTTAVSEPDIPKPIREAKSYLLSDIPKNFDTSELSWDKDSTHTDDRESYFPIEALGQLNTEGVIGDIAPRYHFVPTEFSQRLTEDKDAPETVKACIADQVDIALLIPL